MKQIATVVLGLLVLGVLPMRAGCEQKRLIAVKTSVAPVIDGKLDDACWKEVVPATGFSVFANPDIMHPEQTIGRVCYDDDNLYISLECRVNEPEKFRERLARTAGKFEYFQGGTIEVFLSTNRDRTTFQQYLLHANGSSLITLPQDDVFRILNEDYLISRASLTDTGFNVEMSFPLAMLHLGPDTAKVWGFNLNRVHETYDLTMDNNVRYSSWSSTKGAGFQTPRYFGDLVMEDDLSRFYWKVDFVQEPQPGDKSIGLRIENQTGLGFRGKLNCTIIQPGGRKTNYEKNLALAAGQSQEVVFRHVVSAEDMEAKYMISLADSSGRVCYLGGTEKRDLTPGDEWQAPVPNERQKRAGYILFSRPYIRPVLYKSVPKSKEIFSSLSIAACRGEFEPATFAIYPLRNLESLRVTVSNLKGPDGAVIPASAVDIRRVAVQSVWDNPRVFTAVEHLLRTFDALNLVEGRAQKIWLTIKVPEDAAPGQYAGTVSLSSTRGKTRFPLNVRVLPFELEKPGDMAYFMYFPNVCNLAYSNEAFFRKIIRDQRDHGITSFTIYNIYSGNDSATGKPGIQVDTMYSGYLSQPPYGVSYAKMMEILQEAGIGSNAPLLEISNMRPDKNEVVALFKIYQERNWPQVAFYIGDEIDSPERIEAARGPLETLKKAAPNIKTATALGDMGKKALGPLYDIWISGSSPAVIAECLAAGKSPWTYSCRPIYEIGGEYVRNFFGRYPWYCGLKGVGLWAYAHGDVFFSRFGQMIPYEKDTVFMSDWRQTFGHVVFEKNEIIPVVTWEAVREGIDDYRYMLTLKKLAEAALSSGDETKQAAGKAGLELLRDISERTDLTPALNDFGGSPYLKDSRYMGDMDAERAKVIEAVLRIMLKE